MPIDQPRPVTAAELRARRRRVSRIAQQMGFVGRVEYWHVYSQTGGAQYGLAASPEQDLLVVYAEAFERDANPDDFSLEAIIAHERGHQLLRRHPRLGPRVGGRISLVSEEILASILGAVVSPATRDRDTLLAKVVVDFL